MMELDHALINKILDRGSDVIIRRRKRNGELVDAVFECKMRIADEKPTEDKKQTKTDK